jgi:hypothetical protein
MSVLTLNIKSMWDYICGNQHTFVGQQVFEPSDVDVERGARRTLHFFGQTPKDRNGQDVQLTQSFSSLSPVADALDAAHENLAAQAAEIRQLKFLLASAPMIDAPILQFAHVVATTSKSPFAYINPKTMAKLFPSASSRFFYVFPGSPTKWVLLSTMPEGRVIYSLFPIPGLEKILAQ